LQDIRLFLVGLLEPEDREELKGSGDGKTLTIVGTVPGSSAVFTMVLDKQ
jgi:hypothetical protein